MSGKMTGDSSLNTDPTVAPPTPSIRDRIIADAKDLPSLIAQAEVFDPELAKALVGKALLASKSVYGPAIGAVISWAVTRYGLAWDDNTSAIVTGGIIVLVSAAIRLVTAGPIVSILPQKDSTP